MNTTQNLAASVHQRLLNRARNDKRPFNELLQYYAMERLLYRLSKSRHAECFVLKGALMLRVWQIADLRPTMDIDMLGKTSNETSLIIKQIHDIMTTVVTPDGIIFAPETVQSERITEEADYEGIRVRFAGMLGKARIAMQVDIGFGDIIYPDPEIAELPTILDSPTPKLLCYSRESAIAEKFEVMVKLGRLNSRMKDFYDIWLLSRQFDFDGMRLAEAIRLTFEQRETALPQKIEAFEVEFIDEKKIQWLAFRKRLQQDHVPESFGDIVSAVDEFLTPLVAGLSQDNLKPMSWSASGPWSQS